MTQFYSDPARQADKWSLPDCEVFYVDEIAEWVDPDDPDRNLTVGWYFWFCLPGCMPDSEPVGPFETEEDAIADCRDNWGMD